MLDAVQEAAERKKLLSYYRKFIATLPPDDQETLLRAANERWQYRQRPPGEYPSDLEEWHTFLKDGVAFRHEWPTSRVANFCTQAFARVFTGTPPDLRDSENIAQEFLARVHQLVVLPGGDDMDAVFAKARENVLEGVPTGYRRVVLERVLDAEEDQLRESGAAPEEVEALQAEREARRERGWRALTGKGGGLKR